MCIYSDIVSVCNFAGSTFVTNRSELASGTTVQVTVVCCLCDQCLRLMEVTGYLCVVTLDRQVTLSRCDDKVRRCGVWQLTITV